MNRSDDPAGLIIDRKIPLWGILTVVGGLLVQAVIMWNGQAIQAAEMRHQSEQMSELSSQVKTMITQLATKDGVDFKQDIQISEILQRLTILEGKHK